ncbi:hypothetical protein [Niastella sp. OAS944]|uniref:hypothetical protein n=1 Tax=Niastella sp. OAS944 TaxID=2664089 RepID=UPI0034715985|nr:hypothetical protein [Chitinophagaceae bacterium OAS944]
MEKHVRDKLVQIASSLYKQKWNAIQIREALIEKGKLTPEMARQIEEAGRRDYKRMKRSANAHIASGSFLFVVGVLITWGAFIATGGGLIVVCFGVIGLGIAEFLHGLRIRSGV